MFNLGKFSNHRVYLYSIMLLLVSAGLFISFYYFGYFKSKCKKWIEKKLKKTANIEIKWSDISLDLFESQIEVSDLDISFEKDSGVRLIAPRAVITYSPLRLLGRQIFLKDINAARHP